MNRTETPIVLCGLGRMGRRVLEYLQAAGLARRRSSIRLAGPTTRGLSGARARVRGHPAAREPGSGRRRHGRRRPRSDQRRPGQRRRRPHGPPLNPDVRIVLRMFNQNLISRLGKAVHNVFALSTSLLTAPILAMTALTGQGLGAFRLEGRADGLRQVADCPSPPVRDLLGHSLGAVAGPRLLVLAHFPRGRPGPLPGGRGR